MDAGDVVYDRNNVTKVNLTLLDSSLSQINVHLWGKMATLFRMELQMSRNKNVVLIVTGLLVKPDKDKIILSSTPATDLFFNLNCRQLQHLPQHITDTYGDFISSVPNRPRYPYKMLPEADTTPLNSTIRELLHPRDSTPQKLRCNAIILDLLLEDNLHHASCIRCKELVNPEGNKYYCGKCARTYIIPTVNRPTFSLLVVDRTGNTNFTLREHTLKQLTGNFGWDSGTS